MHGLQTLVVDDSPSARLALQKILESQGMIVTQSDSASDAIEYLKTHKPDLIFMDHCMPGMNGLEALQVIGKDPATASIPIVMYTAQNDPDYVRTAKAHGARDLIAKPASPERIEHVLSAMFDAQRSSQSALNALVSERLDQMQQALQDMIEQRFTDLQTHLEARLEQAQKSHNARELLPLMHSIADAKIHRLNIDLRNHLSARLAVFSEDLIAESRPSVTPSVNHSAAAMRATHEPTHRLTGATGSRAAQPAAAHALPLRQHGVSLVLVMGLIALCSYFLW